MNFTENTQPENSLADFVALEYILLGDLRDLLEEPEPDEQTAHWIGAVLDALLEALPREMELKSEGGYLQPVLEQFPNWASLIGDLASEKHALFDKLRELRAQIGPPGRVRAIGHRNSPRPARMDDAVDGPRPARTPDHAKRLHPRCRLRRLNPPLPPSHSIAPPRCARRWGGISFGGVENPADCP